MDMRELARAQMVLAILVNAHNPHTWSLCVSDQVVPVQPEFTESGVRFAAPVNLAEPWEGPVGMVMDGDLVWSFPATCLPSQCDVAFCLGTRLDPVG
jgi:hypothetical protein